MFARLQNVAKKKLDRDKLREKKYSPSTHQALAKVLPLYDLNDNGLVDVTAFVNVLVSIGKIQDNYAFDKHLEDLNVPMATESGIMVNDCIRLLLLAKLEWSYDDLVNLYYAGLEGRERSGLMKSYFHVGTIIRRIVQHWIFNTFGTLVILAAGILVGIQTYPGMEENETILTLDSLIMAWFEIEILMKIFSDPYRPRMFFCGPNKNWNIFDFVIVVACMPFMPFGNAAAAMRLLRLLRVLKLLSKNPQLQMILGGLMVGMESASYIGLLMALVFYVYAVAGLEFFHENDPWHFGDFQTTLVTLFRMGTLEDWTDVMYINYYGCEWYPLGGGTIYNSPRKKCPGPDVGLTVSPKMCSKCDSKASPVTSYIYFHTFVVMVALILMSMFVGAITIAMSGILEELNEKQQDAAKSKRANQTGLGSMQSEDSKSLPLSQRKLVHRIQKNLLRVLGSEYETTFMEKEVAKLQGGILVRGYFYLGMFCHKLTKKAFFVNFIAVIIVFAGVLVGLQTDGVVSEENKTIQDIDLLIVIIFAMECILKIIGEIFEPCVYFSDSWNRFDFVIVVTSMPFLEFLFGGGTVVLRLLRLMRVLKLLRVSPTLQLLVTALLNAMSSIGYIGIILILFYYLFAISGNILFRTNDPWHFGNMHLSMMSLFRASTLEDWTDIMYTNMYGCDKYAGYPYYLAPGLCTDPYGYNFWAAGFFISFIVIGGFILLSLFIGIVAAEMEHCQDNMMQAARHAAVVKKFAKDNLLSGKTISMYKQLFDLCEEVNPSGGVSYSEMKAMLSMTGTPVQDDESFQKLYSKVDVDGDGQLDYPEFCVLLYVTNYSVEDAENEDGGKKREQKISDKIGVQHLELPDLIGFLANPDEALAAKGGGMSFPDVQTFVDNLSGVQKWMFGNYKLMINPCFQSFMLGVVVFAGLLVGLQVGYGMEDSETINNLDMVVLVLFALEILVKFSAYHPYGLATGIQVTVACSSSSYKGKKGPIVGQRAGDDNTDGATDRASQIRYMVLMPDKEVHEFTNTELAGRSRTIMERVPCLMGVHLFFTGPERYWNWFDFAIVVASIPGVMGSAASVLRLLRLARVIKIIDRVPKLKVIVSGLVSGLNSVCYIMVLMALVFYIYSVLGVSLFKENDPWHFDSMALAAETLFRCATLEDWTDVWFTNYYGCHNYTNEFYVEANSTMFIEPFQANCTSIPQPVTASIFFVSFTVISSFVMMALFVGSILISIMDAVDTINKEVQAAKKKQRRKKQKEAVVAKDSLSERLRRQQIGNNILAAWEHSADPKLNALAEKQRRLVRELSQLPGPYTDYTAAASDVYDPSTAKNPFMDFTADISLLEAKHFAGWRYAYFIAAYRCRQISNNAFFQNFINLVIVFAAGMVGVQAAHPLYQEQLMKALDSIVSFIFLVEVIVHIVQEGFSPKYFFYGKPECGWNRLDFIIVISSYTPIGSLALLFRMVRLARVLKALKALPQLRVMVMALVNSLDSITFVCILMFLVYYIFAIFGIMLFQKNDPWHFGNLHITLMTLFRVASGEDWTDVMYTAQYGCKKYPSPSLEPDACKHPEEWGFYSVAYFIIFFTLGGLVFLNLFIGVITAGMADALGGYEDEKTVTDRIEDFIFYNGISDGTKETKEGLAYYEEEDDVVGPLIKAFLLTDITEYGHLDRQDVRSALQAIHLAPSEDEMDAMMEPANGLFVGCSCTVVNHADETKNGKQGVINMKVKAARSWPGGKKGATRYELKMVEGFASTTMVVEAVNLSPDQEVEDSTTLDKASWLMSFVNAQALIGMKNVAETAHREQVSGVQNSTMDRAHAQDDNVSIQSKKVIV